MPISSSMSSDTERRCRVETETMGRVLVKAKIENAGDLYLAEKGLLSTDQVHRLEVDEALVDTGATYISMPRQCITQLGFEKPYRVEIAKTAAGDRPSAMYGPVRLTLQERIFHGDISEVA